MSLKDLLGLFDDKKTNQSTNLNVSLQQGASFNSMQSRIEASVEPRLALIEQTTEPGLGSIIENFSGNSSEAPLAKVNTAEYKQLQDLEDNFNKAVSAYTQKQNALMKSTNRNTPGAAGRELDTMFKALQAKATELQQKTMAFHGQQQQLTGDDGQLTQQKSSTLQQLKELQSQQSRLNKLMTEGDTLSATIHDNTLQMNAAYMRYFVWLGAAITLGLVAMHRAAK